MRGGAQSLLGSKARKLFVENGIFTERELEARFEIKNEIYLKKLQIESRVLGDLALNHIIPTAITYQNTLIENVKGLKEILPDVYNEVGEVQLKAIKEISTHIKEIRTLVDEMTEARKVANNSISNEVERAQVILLRFYRIWIKSVITSISWNYSSTMRSGPYRNTGNYFSLNRDIQ